MLKHFVPDRFPDLIVLVFGRGGLIHRNRCVLFPKINLVLEHLLGRATLLAGILWEVLFRVYRDKEYIVKCSFYHPFQYHDI